MYVELSCQLFYLIQQKHTVRVDCSNMIPPTPPPKTCEVQDPLKALEVLSTLQTIFFDSSNASLLLISNPLEKHPSYTLDSPCKCTVCFNIPPYIISPRRGKYLICTLITRTHNLTVSPSSFQAPSQQSFVGPTFYRTSIVA